MSARKEGETPLTWRRRKTIVAALTALLLASLGQAGAATVAAKRPSFDDVRSRTTEFIGCSNTIRLTPQQEKTKREALGSIPRLLLQGVLDRDPLLSVMAAVAAAGTLGFGQDAALLQDERNTIERFRAASHAVVHVEARAAAETKFEKRVVEAGTASRFFVDGEWRVLTNAHVIAGRNEIDVVLGSGRRLSVSATRSGCTTLTVGVVSALNRTVPGTAVELRDALIQTDAAIDPGNSGGPLLNSAGEVVGVNALGTDAQRLGFAIPIHLARRVIADLIEMGHAYRPQLGFDGVELSPSLARLFGLPLERGYLVEEVLPQSPAALAGQLPGDRIVVTGDRVFALGGDIITAVNGQAIGGASDIARLLLEARPGDLLRLEVHRGGARHEVAIPLEPMRMF